jgi:hypothetical protein
MKYNIAHQQEPQGKSDEERNDESADMRTYGNKRKVYNTFIQYVIIADKIKENIQRGIASAAGQVAKSFNIHDLLKRRIKEIYYGNDNTLHVNWAQN